MASFSLSLGFHKEALMIATLAPPVGSEISDSAKVKDDRQFLVFVDRVVYIIGLFT